MQVITSLSSIATAIFIGILFGLIIGVLGGYSLKSLQISKTQKGNKNGY